MQQESKFKMLEQFKSDVMKGLSSSPKFIPSKYFYDEQGSRIFQQIMELEEYYPTNCEREILEDNHKEIYEIFSEGSDEFNLIEFGAGDGMKTKILIERFLRLCSNFQYLPIDISEDSLLVLEEMLKSEFPELKMQSIHNDYFEALNQLSHRENARRNVVLFLGSNIGNFRNDEAVEFLKSIHDNLNKGDLLFIGFDLKKNPRTILNAYNDPKGITKSFNLNLLERMNRELSANFDIEKFTHYPTYDPDSGEAKSYIVSEIEQNVTFKEMEFTAEFSAGEPIFVEISQKYDSEIISKLANASNFAEIKRFHDSELCFTNAIWKAL